MKTYFEEEKQKYDKLASENNLSTFKQQQKYMLLTKAYEKEKYLLSTYNKLLKGYKYDLQTGLNSVYMDKKKYNKNLDLYLKYQGLSQSYDLKKKYQNVLNENIKEREEILTQNFQINSDKLYKEYANEINKNKNYHDTIINNSFYLDKLDESKIASVKGDIYTLHGESYKLKGECDIRQVESYWFVRAVREQGFMGTYDLAIPNGFSVTLNDGILFSKNVYIYKDGKWFKTEKQ